MREKIRVLVACEESQAVCIAFRNLGYQAYSCDVIDCSGGFPEWHIKDDVIKHLGDGWDLLIAHPPCTYLSNAGATWLFPKKVLNQSRYEKGMEAKNFFMALYNAPIKRIAVENPIPSKIFNLPKYNQVIQPYQFGHPFSKKTCLWLKNLPTLNPTKVLTNYTQFVSSGSACRRGIKSQDMVMGAKNRSKTFSGIAEAMAEQWGKVIEEQETENDTQNKRSQ
jgi:hypothetical protein